MNKKYIAYFLLLTIVLTSCSTKKSILNFGSEDFDSFYKQFKTVKEFQFERIEFPVEYWSYENIHIEKNSGLNKTLVNKDQISYSNFKFDAPVQENIVNRDGMIIVQIRGIDSGIYIDFYFKMSKGKWLLFKIKDSSN